MFQKLRARFISIAMFSVIVVLVGILGIINFVYYLQLSKNADRVLDYLAAHNGTFPEDSFSYGNKNNPFSEETPYRTRFFTVSVDTITGTTSINMGHVAAIQPSEAYNYALNVAKKGKASGTYDDYRYKIIKDQNGYTIIFLDWDTEIESFHDLFLISLLILLISVLIIFILISLLSKPIINPVIENIEKQRQFITNASHELKTPLSIISADTEVIEIIHGEDEWTDSIKEQVHRLDDLVKDMLTLAKMENNPDDIVVSKFNISESVKKSAELFNPVAVNDKKQFIQSIQPDINFSGNQEAIETLISVLLNNAFKYSNNNGTITLNVYQKGKSTVVECTNTTDHIPEGNLNRLFDRFYRDDNSRSRKTGSYGIGLSIAKAATEQHNGQITAEKIDDNMISFKAVLNPINK